MTDPIRPPRTVEDLMLVTGLGRDTVKALIRTGQLPGHKPGRKYVIPAAAFDAYCRGEWRPHPLPQPVQMLQRRKAS